MTRRKAWQPKSILWKSKNDIDSHSHLSKVRIVRITNFPQLRNTVMYVCVCHAVTDRQIREAAQGGARTLKDLRRDLGVTRDCGRCASCARDCLQEANAGQNKPGKSLRKTA
jgi:bacterioferritin-associated ferredoxin